MLVFRVTASKSVGGGTRLNLDGELRRVPVGRVADVERTMRRYEEPVRRALGFLRSWPQELGATDIMLRFAREVPIPNRNDFVGKCTCVGVEGAFGR